MNITIQQISESQKSVLRQLIELYEYDFSEYNDQDLNEYGFYGYSYLDYYWTEPGRVPLFIMADGKYAGFVLVNEHCYFDKAQGSRSIAEFFVMRKYRKKGIGHQVAAMVFDELPGHWEVAVHPENHGSRSFWQKVVTSYTRGQYEVQDVQTEDWKGTAFLFQSGLQAADA